MRSYYSLDDRPENGFRQQSGPGEGRDQTGTVASDFQISKTEPPALPIHPLRAGYRPKKPDRLRKRNDDRVDVEWLRSHEII